MIAPLHTPAEPTTWEEDIAVPRALTQELIVGGTPDWQPAPQFTVYNDASFPVNVPAGTTLPVPGYYFSLFPDIKVPGLAATEPLKSLRRITWTVSDSSKLYFLARHGCYLRPTP